MTFSEFFQVHPVYSIILILIAFILLLETLMLPFKIDMCYNALKRIETLLTQIEAKIEVNKSIDLDYQKMVSLMQTFLGKDRSEK